MHFENILNQTEFSVKSTVVGVTDDFVVVSSTTSMIILVVFFNLLCASAPSTNRPISSNCNQTKTRELYDIRKYVCCAQFSVHTQPSSCFSAVVPSANLANTSLIRFTSSSGKYLANSVLNSSKSFSVNSSELSLDETPLPADRITRSTARGKRYANEAYEQVNKERIEILLFTFIQFKLKIQIKHFTFIKQNAIRRTKIFFDIFVIVVVKFRLHHRYL